MAGLLAYLGPSGTFTEEAAMKYCKTCGFLLRPYSSIREVITALEKEEVDEGIVPIENSLEGTVTLTLESLRETRLKIKGELHCRIRHFLLSSPGQQMSKIVEVHSHPQALAQCQVFLNDVLPHAELINSPSTAGAAETVIYGGEGKAAIASQRAAVLYNMEVLQEDIQDDSGHNVTRFLVLACEDAPITGNDKTSLLIGLEDKPGSLYSALAVFARHSLNLSKIESRPVRGELGKYIFFMDIEGHRAGDKVSSALEELKDNALFVKVLGSYPKAVV